MKGRAIVLSVLMVLSVVSVGTVGADTPTAPIDGSVEATEVTLASAPDCSTVGYTGSGTASDPYQVSTVDQLQCMGNGSTSTDLNDSFVLTSDIDASGTATWNGGAGFAPVGSSSAPFNGSFDGGGYTVANLTIDRPGDDGVGLFGYVDTAGEITNVTLVNATVTGESNTGTLVGNLDGGDVRNSSATGTVTESGNYDAYNGGLVGFAIGANITSSSATVTVNGGQFGVGGLVGYLDVDTTLTNSHATGNVSGEEQVGGLTGSVEAETTYVIDSYATGSVDGTNNVGGLVGFSGGTVLRSNASGAVNGTDYAVGGLVGTNEGQILYSNATGTVDGTYQSGGLVGLQSDSDAVVRESYATGNVSAGSSNRVGGLVGDNGGTVVDSYSTGAVSGGDKVGGLVGLNDNFVTRSYATGPVSGSASVGGLVGDDLATVEKSYWDELATNQANALGSGSTDGSVQGFDTDDGSGRALEMLGDNAPGNMTALDFTSIWATRTDDYPSFVYKVGNGAPVAKTDSFYGFENTTLTVSAPGTLDNDRDPDGDDLTMETTPVTSPSHGTLTLNADGSIEYTPDAGFTGQDSFTYRVSDGSKTDTATVTITISGQVDVNVTTLAGDGSASNPYVITNASELQAMEDDLSANYTLGNDIDASGTEFWNEGKGFDPVGERGFDGTPFSGSLDGGTHTITGLYIDRPNTGYVGLFEKFVGGTITDIHLHNVDITGQNDVGSLVGESEEDSNNVNPQFRNVSASGSVTATGTAVGGLIGTAQRGAIESANTYLIANASVNVSVTGKNLAGGLVGSPDEPLVIRDSYAAGDVTGTDAVGGLAGESSARIVDSYATGDVTGDQDVGGLIGRYGTNRPTTQSYATGNVSGTSKVGGFVGEINSDNAVINESYATGDVDGSSRVGGFAGENIGRLNDTYATGDVNGSKRVGGLVGQNGVADFSDDGNVTDSYAIGTVTGTNSSTTGGLVGLDDFGTVTTSYWDTQTTGQSSSAGGTGLTTAEMTGDDAPGNMTGLDFTNTWDAVLSFDGDADGGYPVLLNNTQSPAPGLDVYAGGDGSADNPYRIANWTHLDDVRDRLGANFTLVADLNRSTEGYDAVANASANGGSGFQPLGTNSNPFTGRFDGNGHTITGLTIDRPGEDRTGLFGVVASTGTITDVTLREANVTGRQFSVGGLVGKNGGLVTKSSVSGEIVGAGSGDGHVGGLVGKQLGTVRDSSASATVTATSINRVGGLVGANQGTIENGSASGDVTAAGEVGGLVGLNTGGGAATIRDSRATGTVTGSGNQVGGLVGRNDDDITNSFATGDVEGADQVGGLVGANLFAGTALTDSYATGNVTGSNKVGGLVGFNEDEIRRSYAVGTVSGTSNVGGLVGNNTGTVANAYWDVNATNQTGSEGGTGLTTSEMLGDAAKTNMSALDFSSTWGVVDNATSLSYPYLLDTTQEPAPGLRSKSAEFTVTLTDVTTSVTAGEDVRVNATIENVGTLNGTQTIDLTVNGTLEANRSITLNVSERTNETFTYTTVSSDVPAITIAVASDNDTAASDVTVNGVPTALNDSYATKKDVTLSVPAPGVLGNDTDPDNDTLTVNTTPVTPPSNGTVSLATNGSFEYTPDAGFVGTDSFTYEVSDGENATDTATVTITVEETMSNFSVAVDRTNSPVTETQTLTVDVTVRNDGLESGTQNVTLAEFNGMIVDSQSVSLGPGNSTTITLEWPTQIGDAGSGTVTVASANDTATQNVTVEQATDDFAVTIDSTPTVIKAGEALRVDVTVENLGNASGTQEITLSDLSGSEVASQSVTLDAGASETITLIWNTRPSDAGYGTVTVASEDDTDEGTVKIREYNGGGGSGGDKCGRGDGQGGDNPSDGGEC